jgi:hypothetical protein
VAHDITIGGDGSSAVFGEVIAVVVDTAGFGEFLDYPGAIDVVVVTHEEPSALGDDDELDGIGDGWVLVSPAGHRVPAICVLAEHVPFDDVPIDDLPAGGRTERHFAVGPRDRRFVELGGAWLLERAGGTRGDCLEALLLRSEPPLTRRNGVVLTLAVDQGLAPALRNATHVTFVDVPHEPRAAVLRLVEDQTDGPAHTVIEVDLPSDPWLGVGGVFRLCPHTAPALRLLS